MTTAPARPLPVMVLCTTAAYYGLTPSDITCRARSQRYVVPRQVCMWMLRELTTLSLPDIGMLLGRDHTTVLHGVRKIEAQRDVRLANDLAVIAERLGCEL